MLRSVDALGVPGDPAVSLYALAANPGGRFTVGRNPDSNLLLEHPDFPFLISRSHAEFVIVDGKLCVLDKGSTNGVYLNRKKLERAVVTQVLEGGKVHFGGTEYIVKDGNPQQNPFAFMVCGVAALLDAAHAAAAPGPMAPDTQEAGAANALVEALMAAAPSHGQQQQQQPPPAVQTVPPVQQISQPQSGQPAVAGEQVAEPREVPAAEQQPVPPAPPALAAASQGLVDLTVTPENARSRAAASGRVNEIVDLTEEDGDGDLVLSSYALQLGRLPPPPKGSGSERSRKRKEAASSQVLVEEADDATSGEGTSEAASRSVLSKLEDDFECVICRDMLVSAHTLVPCGHVFCGHCLMGWLQKNASCPNCRTTITAPPVPALLINNMAEGLEGRLAPEDAAERERRKKEWKEVSGAAVAGWKAMFAAGGRPAAARRLQHPGADMLNRMFPVDFREFRDVFQLGIPQVLRAPAGAAAGPRRSPRGTTARARRQQQGATAAEAALAPQTGAAADRLTGLQNQSVAHLMEQLGAAAGAGGAAGGGDGGRGGRRAYPQEWLRQQGQDILVRGIPVLRPAPPPDFGVDYHGGSRATCSGCDVLIAPGTVRLHQARRMPAGIMSMQYWHLQCYPHWDTRRPPLPGTERLAPSDQALVQRHSYRARDGVVRL